MSDEIDIRRMASALLIPRSLVEQLRHREFDVDDWYRMQVECSLDPNNLMLGVYKGDDIVGFIWAIVDNLSKTLFVNSVSVHREHQDPVKLLPSMIPFIREIADSRQLRRIRLTTDHPRIAEKHGFKRSRWHEMDMELSDG